MYSASLWSRTRPSAKARRLLMLLAAASVVVTGYTGSSVADASTPTLSLSDMGQPSAPVIVGQPALTVAPSGTCEAPFTIETESACPPGNWPGLGTTWGPVEDVAGGDELQLTFSSPVSSVIVASTSNYPPGLTNPSGQAVPNYDVLAPTAAQSASSTVWHVTLPSLDIRAISGYTLSVVADDTSGDHDYALTIRSPRYANELTKCSEAYYSTGNSQYLCLSNGVPPGLPTPGGQAGTPSTTSPTGNNQPAPIPNGPPLGASTVSYAHGRLRIAVAVPTAGTLTISIPTRGRHDAMTTVRHVTHSGDLAVTQKVAKPRFVGNHQIVLHMVLHASTGFFKRTQTIRVR